MIIAALVVHFVNGWMSSEMDESIRVMLNLIVFIVIYMMSNRYLKSFRD